MMKKASGFTLIELMVTISILAILSTIAVPGFQALIQNSRATTLANELVSTFNYARSEAVRRGATVSVCSDNWVTGWRVELGTSCNASDANILRFWESPQPGSVISSNNITAVGFEPTGARFNPGSNEVTFQVHVENCKGLRARTLRISPSGRIGVERVDCPAS